jgi:hypothetical protein
MTIEELKKKVDAAWQEFNMAMEFHETWKPAAYDNELHKRMGESCATNAFNVVQAALRREMLLALMRLWDTRSNHSVGMVAIGEAINESVVRALAADRVGSSPWPGVEDQMREDLSRLAGEAKTLIDQYSNGSHKGVFNKLHIIRNTRLAHLQTTTKQATVLENKEIEEFYQVNAKLVSLLLCLVNATACDPEDFAAEYRRNAGFFWEPVRGERTEGHPDYRAVPKIEAA